MRGGGNSAAAAGDRYGKRSRMEFDRTGRDGNCRLEVFSNSCTN